MLNIFFLSIFSSFSRSKELNITDLVIGKWYIKYFTYTGNDIDTADPRRMVLNVKAVDDYFTGNLTSASETDSLPFSRIILNKTVISNENKPTEYRLAASYATNTSNEFKQLFGFVPVREDVDELVQIFGVLDSNRSFSFNMLSKGSAEVTIFDRTNKQIGFIRFHQTYENPAEKNKMILQVLLPLIPVFLMMYNQSKQKNEEIRRHEALQTSKNQKQQRSSKKD